MTARRLGAGRLAALVAGAALASCGPGPTGPGASAGPPPDVLIVVMDTTRADRCSFLGYDRPTTPHLEALAAESVVFTDAWSPSPWTFPAHAALFTGRTPESLGIVDAWPPRIDDRAETLASVLGRAGWRTASFSCNAWIAPHTGLTRGFGTVDPVFLSPRGESAAEAHDHALAWMTASRRAGKPFFAFINDVEPHAPWMPPARFQAQFVNPAIEAGVVAEARGIRYPRTLTSSFGVEPVEGPLLDAVSGLYDAEIAGLDEELGRLFDGMRRGGLLDRTLVVVAGDHGEGLGAHGWLGHGSFLHRELLRVPLLVRPPGGTAGRRVADVVRLQDVFPTVLEVCGLPVPAGLGAASLLGDTSGRIATAAERTRVDVVEAMAKLAPPEALASLRAGRRSVYDGRWFLVEDDRGTTVLHDLVEDPAAEHDRAQERPETVRSLRARLGPRPPR